MKLDLALSDGSLFENSQRLFGIIGIPIFAAGRNFNWISIEHNIIKRYILMRPQIVVQAVYEGVANIGITGLDCKVESGLGNKLIQVCELPFSKSTRGPVKIAIFSKKQKNPTKGYIDHEIIRVSTEYIRITKKYFKKARIDFSPGKTEANVASGMYDYGVGVVETGKSLEASGLEINEVILISPTVLIAKKMTPEIELLGRLLVGALESENYNLIKMNVSASNKNMVLKVLPALKAPTISRLANKDYAIETIAKKSELTELLQILEKLGASGIIVQDMNIVL